MEGKVKLQGQATGREDERTTGRRGQSRPNANIVSGTRVKTGDGTWDSPAAYR